MFSSLSIRSQGKVARHKSNASTRTNATGHLSIPPRYSESFAPQWWMGAPEEVLPPSYGPDGQVLHDEPAAQGSGSGVASASNEAPPPQYRPPSTMGTARHPSLAKPPTRSESTSSTLSYTDPPSDSSGSSTPTAAANRASTSTDGPSPYSEDAYRQFVAVKKPSLASKAFGSLKLGSKKSVISVDDAGVPEPEMPLTEAEREMYAAEKLDNFRWLSTLAGRYADCPPLSEKDEVNPTTANKISGIGKFAELVYSPIFIDTLIKHNKLLDKEGVLTDYTSLLSDCVFVRQITGVKTDLSAFVVFRRSTRQLVVSISGSSKPKHTVQNLRAMRTPWPPNPSATATSKDSGVAPRESSPPPNKDGPGVHSGFLALYRDVKTDLEQAVLAGVTQHSPEELVLTGHSMGGSIAYLFALDLLSGESLVPLPGKICLVTFGMPRTGNAALVQHFKSLLKAWQGGEVEEYSVKACNDGVPAVPLRSMGYAHFCDRPMYAFRKKLYWVPEGHHESSLFRVQHTPPQSTGSSVTDEMLNTFPRGGHNYYNGRDLEALRRMSENLLAAGFPGRLDIDWKDGVLQLGKARR